MNVLTLGKMYPGRKNTLSATQMISLHLFHHRPRGDEDSLDPMFGPYISVLPRDFDSHPLTWRIKCHFNPQEVPESLLLGCLPADIIAAVAHVEARFWGDFQTVLDYMVSRLPFLYMQRPRGEEITNDIAAQRLSRIARSVHYEVAMNYLWAWLNGNYSFFPTIPADSSDNLVI